MRSFNRNAVLEVKELRAGKTGAWKKKTVERVEGRQRIELYGNHCDAFSSKVAASRAAVGDEKYKKLLEYIANDNNKISRVDLDARKDRYAEGVDKPRKITKSEVNVCGADVPAEMDGGLKKKDIQSKYDKEIKAEMEHRRIRYPEGEDGEPKPFKKLTMKEKRDLLVLDEIRVLAAEGKARDGIEPRNVKYIVPQSTEMKDLAARINSS